MSKSDKIILGILLGGIVILVVSSVFFLFRKMEDERLAKMNNETKNNANITPYPTIPPIVNHAVFFNGKEFNPVSVTIPRGGYIQFLNMDFVTITIEANNSRSSLLQSVGEIAPGQFKDITFETSGNYEYRIKENSKIIGTIIVK